MLLFDWTFLPLEEYIKPINDVSSEFLIICLSLAPHVEYDKLWHATSDNCGADGKFIGKWSMHKLMCALNLHCGKYKKFNTYSGIYIRPTVPLPSDKNGSIMYLITHAKLCTSI